MPEPEKLSPVQFDRFRDFIYRQSGIRVDASKTTLVSNRIRRRLRAGDFAGFDAYYKHLTSPQGAAELEQFLDAITTNETHFFRTPNHFDWFRGDFLTEVLLKYRRGERPAELRVWSAACSTGEEPYSLAICAAENSLRMKDWKISIVGTDISEAVLKEARQAIYRKRSLDEVSPVQLKRYFDALPESESWQVRPAIRELVEFRWHNLMEPLRLPPFDCIFIRNVLIYFDRESKQAVIRNLFQALAPGGYLVVGPSEGIYDMLGDFVKKSAFLYQKPELGRSSP
ncbi:MAG TPA: protein-glutamate O-methyltransferase CheR [Planctomycetaceae bacterium]|nr:protein-glutamate O-methyltransferase CheR [Planctomycetaceae bacterium]